MTGLASVGVRGRTAAGSELDIRNKVRLMAFGAESVEGVLRYVMGAVTAGLRVAGQAVRFRCELAPGIRMARHTDARLAGGALVMPDVIGRPVAAPAVRLQEIRVERVGESEILRDFAEYFFLENDQASEHSENNNENYYGFHFIPPPHQRT